MPDVQDLDAACLLRDIIEDAVGAEYNLSQRTTRTSGIRGSDERKRTENRGVVEDATPKPIRRLLVALCDVRADVVEISNRRI